MWKELYSELVEWLVGETTQIEGLACRGLASVDDECPRVVAVILLGLEVTLSGLVDI